MERRVVVIANDARRPTTGQRAFTFAVASNASAVALTAAVIDQLGTSFTAGFTLYRRESNDESDLTENLRQSLHIDSVLGDSTVEPCLQFALEREIGMEKDWNSPGHLLDKFQN
jgi:hypothetical protein